MKKQIRGIAPEEEIAPPGAGGQDMPSLQEELRSIKVLLTQMGITSNPVGPAPETMLLKDAAPLYGVRAEYLRRLATRGEIKAQLVGSRYFVTPAEMDRVFRGPESPLLACPPKPESRKGKLTLKQIVTEYGVPHGRLVAFIQDKRMKGQKLNKRWFVDRSEVERVFGKGLGRTA